MTAETPASFPSRAAIRAIAERDAEEILGAAAAGGNGYQMALDRQDRVIEYAQTLGPEIGQRYIDIYADEIGAITAMRAQANQAAAVSSVRSSVWIGSILTAVSLVIIYLFLTRGD